jgi:hypothetical protein
LGVIVGSFIALWTAATASQSSSALVFDYSIATIEYLPKPSERVGKVQAGLICLPKGKIHWRDVERPSEEALAKRLTSTLSLGGLKVGERANPLFADPVPLTHFRIKVLVERFKLRLCIAGLGIGEKKTSGEGLASIRWETYDRSARTLIDSVTFEVPILVKAADEANDGIIAEALHESAKLYATRRLEIH